MGQFIGFPQLVQNLLLVHRRGHLFLLQTGDFPADGQQFLVLLLAFPSGFHTLTLQLHLFLIELGDGLVLLLVLQAKLLQPSLLLPDLLGKGLIFLLIVANESPALVLVSGQIPAQSLQFLQGTLPGFPFCLQGGQTGVESCQLLSNFQRALLKIILALSLTLSLTFQGGSGALQLLDPVPGALGVGLDLRRALLQLFQFFLLAALLPLQVADDAAAQSLLALGLQDSVLPFTQLGLSGLHLIGGGCRFPVRLLQLPGCLGQAILQPLALGSEPLQLVGPAENTGAAAGAAAGHRAAGVQNLPVQGDDAEAVSVLPCHSDGGIQMLHHDDPSQQVGKDIAVLGRKLHQLIGNAHETGLPAEASRFPQIRGPDGAQGQDGGPAAVPPL